MSIEKKEEKEGKVKEYLPLDVEGGHPEHKFDVGRCGNQSDLAELAPLKMNRNIVMVAIIRSDGKLSSNVECYPITEWHTLVLNPNSQVYSWVPKHENCCSNKSFPVYKLSYSGVWMNHKAKFYDYYFNTFVLFNPKKTPIGSEFGVSSIHGEIYDVYDIRPTNRNNLYDFKDDSRYWKDFENMPYYPLPNDFTMIFQISKFSLKKFDNSVYVGELVKYKNKILRHGDGYEVDSDGRIIVGEWYNNEIYLGFATNKDFTRMFSGEFKNGLFHTGDYLTPNYIYDGKFKNGILSKGKRTEYSTGIVIDGEWKDINTLSSGTWKHFYEDKEIENPTTFFNLDFGNPDDVLAFDDEITPISELPRFKNLISVSIKVSDVINLDILKDHKKLQDIHVEPEIKDINALKGKPIVRLTLIDFNGDLSPLIGAPIKEIYLDKFNGDLSPLTGAPIEQIYLNNFEGDLSPLKGAPIEEIHLGIFEGDISPLKGAPIRFIDLGSFQGDISPLKGAPIDQIHLSNFEGDISPLKGAPIQFITLNNFNGDLSPLKGAPIKLINLNNFEGDLSPLKGAPIENIYLNIFTGDFTPLNGAPIKNIYIWNKTFNNLDEAIKYYRRKLKKCRKGDKDVVDF